MDLQRTKKRKRSDESPLEDRDTGHEQAEDIHRGYPTIATQEATWQNVYPTHPKLPSEIIKMFIRYVIGLDQFDHPDANPNQIRRDLLAVGYISAQFREERNAVLKEVRTSKVLAHIRCINFTSDKDAELLRLEVDTLSEVIYKDKDPFLRCITSIRLSEHDIKLDETMRDHIKSLTKLTKVFVDCELEDSDNPDNRIRLVFVQPGPMFAELRRRVFSGCTRRPSSIECNVPKAYKDGLKGIINGGFLCSWLQIDIGWQNHHAYSDLLAGLCGDLENTRNLIINLKSGNTESVGLLDTSAINANDPDEDKRTCCIESVYVNDFYWLESFTFRCHSYVSSDRRLYNTLWEFINANIGVIRVDITVEVVYHGPDELLRDLKDLRALRRKRETSFVVLQFNRRLYGQRTAAVTRLLEICGLPMSFDFSRGINFGPYISSRSTVRR